MHIATSILYTILMVYWSSIMLLFRFDIRTKYKLSIGIYKKICWSDCTYVCCWPGHINLGKDKYRSSTLLLLRLSNWRDRRSWPFLLQMPTDIMTILIYKYYNIESGCGEMWIHYFYKHFPIVFMQFKISQDRVYEE